MLESCVVFFRSMKNNLFLNLLVRIQTTSIPDLRTAEILFYPSSLSEPLFLFFLLPLLPPPHSPPVCYQILPIHSLFFRKNWFQLSCPAPVFPEIFKSGSPATRVLSGTTSTSDARRTKRKSCFVRIESMKADPISGCTAGWGWENAEGYRVEAVVWAIPGS